MAIKHRYNRQQYAQVQTSVYLHASTQEDCVGTEGCMAQTQERWFVFITILPTTCNFGTYPILANSPLNADAGL